MPSFRRAGVAAAAIAVPAALAYRFALIYRTRAGYPRRHVLAVLPSDLGMAYEAIDVAVDDLTLPAWFIPANGGAAGPGVVLVHGWESARDRMLPNAWFLNAAGFHVLVLDVRGHGENPPEDLPISGGEFGADASAALRAMAARPEVTRVAVLGHSMGGIGAALAAVGEPGADAAVVISAPADPVRLTRQTFRLARLHLPSPVAWPLAWLTTRVYIRPRHHAIAEISASRALRRYRGPLLLVHGAEDSVIPPSHHARLVAAAQAGRSGEIGPAPVETLIVEGGGHSWLYEDEGYRRTVASFLARALGGPLSPEAAADAAAAIPSQRLPDAEVRFAATARPSQRLRTIAELMGARAERHDLGAIELPPEARDDVEDEGVGAGSADDAVIRSAPGSSDASTGPNGRSQPANVG